MPATADKPPEITQDPKLLRSIDTAGKICRAITDWYAAPPHQRTATMITVTIDGQDAITCEGTNNEQLHERTDRRLQEGDQR